MAKGTSKADTLLHPVRLRIVTQFFGSEATVKELATTLADIPQATLYRHIKVLLEAGIISVVDEQHVNGAIERTYGVNAGQTRFSEAEGQSITGQQHVSYFSVFMGSLLDNLKRHVKRRSAKRIAQGGLSYNRVLLYLNAAERIALRKQMTELLSKYTQSPTKDREAYSFALVVIPEDRP